MRTVNCKFIVVGILICGVIALNSWVANAQNDLQWASDVIRIQTKKYIEKTMDLTSQEKEGFWTLYAEYQSGLAKIRGKRIELATNYLQTHGYLSDAEAIAALNQKLQLDSEELKFKQSYVAKFMRVLPARKVVRFYQAEHRFDTAANLQLYRNLPLIR